MLAALDENQVDRNATSGFLLVTIKRIVQVSQGLYY
jgi:hypothetical protein